MNYDGHWTEDPRRWPRFFYTLTDAGKRALKAHAEGRTRSDGGWPLPGDLELQVLRSIASLGGEAVSRPEIYFAMYRLPRFADTDQHTVNSKLGLALYNCLGLVEYFEQSGDFIEHPIPNDHFLPRPKPAC
jgi:hypothetical protein